MSEFEIGQMAHEDVDQLGTLINQGWRDAHLQPELGIDETYLEEFAVRELAADNIAKWHERVDNAINSHSIFLNVARSHGRIVGMIDARFFPQQNHGAIMSCYVNPEWRGIGVAGPAHAMAIRALAWMGPISSDVLIASYNVRSQRFFAHFGYVIPGEQREIGRIPAQIWLRPVADTHQKDEL